MKTLKEICESAAKDFDERVFKSGSIDNSAYDLTKVRDTLLRVRNTDDPQFELGKEIEESLTIVNNWIKHFSQI